MLPRWLVWLFCVTVCWGAPHARAADLRVSLSELATLTRPFVEDAAIRLHNVAPANVFAGIFNAEADSFIRFGAQTHPFDLTPYTFSISRFGNGKYVYYFNDINSTGISLKPIPSALRLSVRFESDKPELTGACYSGTCGFTKALPTIEWHNPRVDIDFIPTRFEGGISLSVKKVHVHGYFRAVCRRSVVLCPLARNYAQRQINKARRTQMPDKIAEVLNAQQNREKIAASLASYLKLGSGGRARIRKLNVSANALVVSFQF